MSQQGANVKARALNKDEVTLLLNFIDKHTVLTTKATNATNNRMKEMAWQAISEEFSAHVGETRRPEQLRLKWENLKKSARKRSASIRQNNLKTGGGKSYIVPDEVLDRVAAMLGVTCTGFTVEFGGDGSTLLLPENTEVLSDVRPLPEIIITSNYDAAGEVAEVEDESVGLGVEINNNYTPRPVLFNTSNSSLHRKRKLNEELLKAQKEKELALAMYFRAKSAKIELENLKLKLEIEQLKKNP